MKKRTSRKIRSSRPKARTPAAGAPAHLPAAPTGEAAWEVLRQETPLIQWTTDAELRITSSAGSGLSLFDLKPNQTVGMTMYEFLKTDDPTYLPIAMHLKALQGETVSYDMEWNGHFFHTVIKPLPRANGTPRGCIGVSLDITERKRLENARDETARRFESIVEKSPDMIAVHADGRYVYINPAGLRLIGADSADQFIGKPVLSIVHPDHHAVVSDRIRQAAGGTPTPPRELQFITLDGRVIDVEVRGIPVTHQGREAIQIFVRDISKRKAAETALRESEERYRRLIEQSPEMVAVSVDGLFAYLNATGAKLLGARRPEELIGRAVRDFIHPDFREVVGERIRQVLEEGRTTPPLEEKFITLDGRTVDVETTASPVAYRGKPALQLMVRDISERKRSEFELLQDVFYDKLTGLPNRAMFLEHLRQGLERSRGGGSPFGVLLLDLDRFKIVNDSLGHTAGDQLLISIAKRLETCIGRDDTVARLSGDEFGILLASAGDARDASRVAERVHQVLAPPFDLAGREIFSSASIGIIVCGQEHAVPEHILRDADTAMNRAKSLGKARHEIFHPEMHESAMALLELETDLRKALERREFRLHYQPIVSLETGRIAGFEALVRWQHPEKGLIAPCDFIPVAEETGLIVPLGWWILKEATRQIRRWHGAGPAAANLTMSVNLSSRQFSQPDLVERVHAALQDAELSARHLKLEITESVIMENAESLTALLLQLRALEIELIIDDFGTGYSSLSYLHRFPVNTLKIDRSFVNHTALGGEHNSLLRAIVNLAHNLDMEVTAEGVETAEQLAQLRTLKCKYAQGFLFSKPVDGETAGRLLASTPSW